MTFDELRESLGGFSGKLDEIKGDIATLKEMVANNNQVPEDIAAAVNALGDKINDAADDFPTVPETPEGGGESGGGDNTE